MVEEIARKAALLYSGTLGDDVIEIYAEMALEAALGYCNVTELPTAATSTIAVMVASLLNGSVSGGAVSSMTEGDRSVSFQTVDFTAELAKGKSGLDRYKTVRMW